MEDITGRRFDRLVVTKFSHIATPGRFPHWDCLCDCGNTKIASVYNLMAGRTRSCGCLQKQRASEARLSHGMSAHPAYRCWHGMRNRCENPEAFDFEHYGGRGIRLSPEWRTFDGFWTDMQATWATGLTIERKDVNGPYEAANCCWIPRSIQSHNRRNSRIIDTPWGRMSAIAAATKGGLPYRLFIQRVRAGWTIEDLFFPPLRSRNTRNFPKEP